MESYEEIVRKWYMKLRKDFFDLLMDKYRNTNMRVKDAEDIYQNAFLAIYENLQRGRIHEKTSWSSYIIAVGLNMASKKYQVISKIDSIDEGYGEDEGRENRAARLVEKINRINEELFSDDDSEIAKDPEAQSLLGDELTHTPEPCASMIRLSYYAGLSAREILEEMPELRTADNVKVRRWKCMKDLTYRVKMALYNAGFSIPKPEKK